MSRTAKSSMPNKIDTLPAQDLSLKILINIVSVAVSPGTLRFLANL